MSAANSPIDPLYWFKNEPFDGGVFAMNGIFIKKNTKWRYVSQQAQDGIFFCEIVGGEKCGLTFFLPEQCAAIAEKVEG
jgi:hypothetical protein